MRWIPFLMVLVALIALFPVAFALSIDVGVQKNYTGEMKDISSISTGNVKKISVEFFNSGSLSYEATARLDAISDNSIIATAWSSPKTLGPGDRNVFDLYTYVNCNSNYTPRIRIYYANDIFEKYYPAEACPKSPATQIIEISDVVFGNDYVAFNARSPTAMNVIINGFGYLPGWRFYEKTASLGTNTTSRLKMYYDADVVIDSPLDIQVFSTDGNAIGSSSATVLTQERMVTNIIDSIFNFISSFWKF